MIVRTYTHPHRVRVRTQSLERRTRHREPAKCSQLVWADPGNLPPDTVDYTAAIIHAVQHGVTFVSTDGDTAHRET
jgi:hypothetical protein